MDLEHCNASQTKFIGDSLYKHPVNATVLMAHVAAAETAGMGEDTITGRADRPELCRAASSWSR